MKTTVAQLLNKRQRINDRIDKQIQKLNTAALFPKRRSKRK